MNASAAQLSQAEGTPQGRKAAGTADFAADRIEAMAAARRAKENQSPH
jgi:hypothetical protein